MHINNIKRCLMVINMLKKDIEQAYRNIDSHEKTLLIGTGWKQKDQKWSKPGSDEFEFTQSGAMHETIKELKNFT